MRKIILNTAVSLDFYIARPDGSVDWLHDPDYEIEGEDYGMAAFYESIDTTLMGNKTYLEILGFDVPFPYPDTTNYVFTRSEAHQDNEHVEFITGDIVSFVKQLKEGEGKDIWLIGGGQINALLLSNDLVDRITLTVVPHILGAGIPLFPDLQEDIKLELSASKPYESGLVQLEFKRRDP